MRNGKIATLPSNIRDELNLRMENGEQGNELLAWLNGLPEVQERVKGSHDGAPVSKQNLSEWRLGGFREWHLHHKLRKEAYKLTEHAEGLEESVDGVLLVKPGQSQSNPVRRLRIACPPQARRRRADCGTRKLEGIAGASERPGALGTRKTNTRKAGCKPALQTAPRIADWGLRIAAKMKRQVVAVQSERRVPPARRRRMRVPMESGRSPES